MKNIVITILIILLLVLGFFFWKNQQNKQTSYNIPGNYEQINTVPVNSASNLNSTANWSTTTFAGLTIKYPPTWKLAISNNMTNGEMASIISDMKGVPNSGGSSFATIRLQTESELTCTNGVLTQTDRGGNISTIAMKCAEINGVMFSTWDSENPSFLNAFDLMVQSAKPIK